jgi:hypothetical protein
MLLSLEAFIQAPATTTSSPAPPKEIDWGSIDISWSEELASFDTAVVLVLTILLLFTLKLRHHHREHNQALVNQEDGDLN